MKRIFATLLVLIPSIIFSQAMPGGNTISSNINNSGTDAGFIGYFIGILLLLFVLPYIIAIVIFAKKKKYNVIKLFCGFTVLWLLLSAIFAVIIYFITGGSINTKGGIKSSLDLS
jgi:hypothetical protein